MTITATPAIPVDVSTVEDLPLFGNPFEKCPLIAWYYELQLRHDLPGLTFVAFVQIGLQFIQLSEREGALPDVMTLEEFVFTEHTTRTGYQAWVVQDSIDQCYEQYEPATPTRPVLNVIDIDEFWTQRDTEELSDGETHKVDVDTILLQASPRTTATSSATRTESAAPAPTLDAIPADPSALIALLKNLPDRVKRLKYRTVPKRKLTDDEHDELKHGRLPQTVTDWRQIDLTRQEQSWYVAVVNGYRPKGASLMKRPRSLATA